MLAVAFFQGYVVAIRNKLESIIKNILALLPFWFDSEAYAKQRQGNLGKMCGYFRSFAAVKKNNLGIIMKWQFNDVHWKLNSSTVSQLIHMVYQVIVLGAWKAQDMVIRKPQANVG